MKISLSKIFLIASILTVFSPLQSFSQNLTGIWRGWFTTDDGEQYKCEIQITQNRNKSIGGVSYSYLDTRFYGKASLSGLYNSAGKSVIIQEIKTVEVKMSQGSVACIMKYMMNYSRSGNEEFLEGSFTSKYEKADFIHKRGDPAGGGTIFLRKVPTSDFYIEPFLRNNPLAKKQTTTTKPPATTSKKPQSKPVVTNKPPVKKPVTTNQTTTKTQTVDLPEKEETIKRNTTPVVIDNPKQIPPITMPATTRSRENLLVKTVTVENPDISVRLYDNGEIDGDTISVYLDGRAIISRKGLSTQPITLQLKMDEDNPEHVLVMVAENLGRIPPNTSLMIVQDGDKRYSVSITSTEQKNAMVRFRYQKK
jgi:hypothetical protein